MCVTFGRRLALIPTRNSTGLQQRARANALAQETADEDSGVVKEAEAMLEGTVRASSFADGERRPPWLYVNRLAHADGATLARLAGEQTALHPASWHYACAILASEVLELAFGKRWVKRALVPLELDLLAAGYIPPT